MGVFDEGFSNKVAVVTGAGGGIGAALSRKFANAGMKLALCDVEEPALNALAEELRSEGVDVHTQLVDVSNADAVQAFAESTMEAFGAVHVVCNNAGVSGGGLTWEIDLATWKWIMDVNLWGVIHGVHFFVPHIIASGGGHVVNTASMAGLTSNPGLGPYNVSKHGVVTLSESLFGELSFTHPEVGVSVLCPGWVKTQINRSERNRPGYSPSDEPERLGGNGALGQFSDLIDQWIAEGLEPDVIADLVFDGIANRKFWLLTHPEWQAGIADRTKRMLEGVDPYVGLPGA